MRSTHGARRLAGGAVRVRLSTRERDVLRSLPGQMRPILVGDERPDGVRERLFPRAYGEAEADAEYRELTEDSIAAGRLDALETFARTLDVGEARRLTWTVDLSSEEAAAWLSALNDTRLTLGVLLGVRSERDWERGPDERNPSSVVLWYLGWLQEELIGALAQELGDQGIG